jgi:pimeloyl-ACP methyl ester carboxylesterase
LHEHLGIRGPGRYASTGLMLRFASVAILLATFAGAAAAQGLTRRDFFVQSDPAVQIFVREVSTAHSQSGPAILLIHGARVPGLASFDLPVPGGSLAADLATRGFNVYVLDVRGYGRSTRPSEMNEAPNTHPPLVRSNEASRDISAVVDAIHRSHPQARVALFGWATGGQWAGYYASANPGRISALVLLNSLYRGNSHHDLIGHGSDLEDPGHPGRYNPSACGAYRFNDANSLLRPWDHSIPLEDKSAWRDPAVAEAYVEAALASDPSSRSRQPPSFRSPCGALEDSFYLATGRQHWDASLITVPTLILVSERDFWSRPEDHQNLAADLVYSPAVKVVIIPGATHFVHLDREEHGRKMLLDELTSFLAKN